MQVKVALRVIFSKMERFLLRNNRAFVVSSSSSSPSSASDSKPEDAEVQFDKGAPLYYKALLSGAVKQQSEIEQRDKGKSKNTMNATSSLSADNTLDPDIREHDSFDANLKKGLKKNQRKDLVPAKMRKGRSKPD